MNYAAHYDRLINRARSRILEGYKERHHVIPRCMDGSDFPDNLVDLTAEEHFVAHQLLVKMHPKNRKLIYAIVMMSIKSGNQGRSNNKIYGWLSRLMAKAVSERMLGNKYSLGKTHGPNARAAISAAQKGKYMSAGTREKIAAANRGKKQSSETIEKRVSKLRGRPRKKHTLEARAKIKAARARQDNVSIEGMLRGRDALTAEQRSERTRKSWITRHAQMMEAEKCAA